MHNGCGRGRRDVCFWLVKRTKRKLGIVSDIRSRASNKGTSQHVRMVRCSGHSNSVGCRYSDAGILAVVGLGRGRGVTHKHRNGRHNSDSEEAPNQTLIRFLCPTWLLVMFTLLPTVGEAAPFDRIYGALGVSFVESADASSEIAQESEGVSAHLSLGRYLSNRDRMSFDVAYSKFDSSSEFVAPIHQVHTSRVESVGATLSAYRTFFRRGKLSFYAGAGAGMTDAKIRQDFTYTEPGLSVSVKDSYRRFSYNFSLNGSYRLTPRLALDAGYRVNRTTGSQNATQYTASLSIRLSMAPQSVPKDRPAPR